MQSKHIAQRLGGSKFLETPFFYRFGRLKQMKQAIENQGDPQLLDFGIGEPDEMASSSTIETLYQEAKKKENRFYSDNGIHELKEALADYYQHHYKVVLDPTIEINHCLGAKSALSLLPLGFINPDDFVLSTVPGYVVLSNMVKWLGGAVYPLPLRKEKGYFPDLKDVPIEVIKKTKLIYLNYPNNPTGAVATSQFFEEVVKFAKENNLLVVHDAAYLPLTFNKEKELSFLSIPGAKDVGVEIFTWSKGFNMTGWRIGAVVGNAEMIKVFATIKDNCDSGQFIPIQKAAIQALKDNDFTKQLKEKYFRRHQLLAKALTQLGFTTSVPEAGFYQYVSIPKGTMDGKTFLSAEDFSLYLLSKYHIMTIPWDEVGHYLRFSVTFESSMENEESLIHDFYNRLSKESFIF